MKFDCFSKKKKNNFYFITLLRNNEVLLNFNNKKIIVLNITKLSDFFLSLNKENLIIFTSDLNLFALTILNASIFDLKNWKTKSYLLNNTFYYLNFTCNNDKTNKISITFKNFKCYFSINMVDLKKKTSGTLKAHSIGNAFFKKIIKDFKNISFAVNDSYASMVLLKLLDKELSLFVRYWNYKTYSISSSANLLFFSHFNSNDVLFLQSKNEYSIFKKAFYGGRNEVFGNPYKDETVYYYDFPSMYATIMKNEKFAHGNYDIKHYPSYINNNFISIEENNKKREKEVKLFNDVTFYLPGFYKISFNSNLSIPVLPLKTIENGLIFPNGDLLIGLYWYEEIILFLKLGGEINWVFKSYVFAKYDYIFSNFASNLILLRKKNEFNYYLYKTILVSFYGRLGMNYSLKKTILLSFTEYKIFCSDNETNESLTIFQELWLGSFVLVEFNEQKEEKENSSAAEQIDVLKSDVKLAAQISSKARIRLLNFILKLKKNNIKVYYCDTDGVFFGINKSKPYAWDFNDLSLKDLQLKDALFISTKFYYSKNLKNEETVKIAGVSLNTSFKINEIKDNFFFEKNTIISQKKVLNKFQFDKYEIFVNIFFNKYKKRIFTANKHETVPLVLFNVISL